MPKIEFETFSVKHIDELANQDTFIHNLDPRAKVITSFFFIIGVVSFGKYDLSALIPFSLYPIILLSLGNIPLPFLFKRILLAAPFALFIGIFNPLLDQTAYCTIGNITISGGWISFWSIVIRFLLTVSVALILIATTGFNAIGMALKKLGVPKIFIIQLLFLYRYIFVLFDELIRMNRARTLRTFKNRGTPFTVYKQLLGNLLMRSLDRSQRLFFAMQCRGFKGEIHIVNKLQFGLKDTLFILGWSLLFIVMRFYFLPDLIGSYLLRILK